MKAGPQGDGTAYTPAGWRVTPAGAQKPAGFFPANAVLSPDGAAVLIPNIIKDGNSKQTLQVMDAKDGRVMQVVELDKNAGQGTAAGLAFSHDGSNVYLTTANMDTVVVFGWDGAAHKLAIQKTLALPKGSYPQGVAVSSDDKTIYVTGQYARTLIAVDIASGKSKQAAAGAYPFGVVLSADGRTAYVSNQGENTLSVFSVDGLTIAPKSKITVGTHPNNMLIDAKQQRMFVANGDSDTVSIVDTVSNTVKALFHWLLLPVRMPDLSLPTSPSRLISARSMSLTAVITTLRLLIYPVKVAAKANTMKSSAVSRDLSPQAGIQPGCR